MTDNSSKECGHIDWIGRLRLWAQVPATQIGSRTFTLLAEEMERLYALEKVADDLMRERSARETSVPTDDFSEVMEALESLSFDCFAGLGVRAPSLDVYNRTFGVMERLRHKHNDGKAYGGPAGTHTVSSALKTLAPQSMSIAKEPR